MKFFIVFALCVAAASARFVIPDVAAAEAAEIKEILAAINHPSTDPATAAALQKLLNDILGIEDSPIAPGPAIIDESDFEDSPIAPGPAIIDESDFEDSPIAPGPAIIDESDFEDSPIAPGPAIIDESDIQDSPIAPGPAIIDGPIPSSSPLVQIIVNVKPGAHAGPNPVEVIDGSPAIIPEESLIMPGPGFNAH